MCDVSHWKIENATPETLFAKEDYSIVEVVPANEPDFFIRDDIPTPKGATAVVDWGELVALTDSPFQHAYAIYRKTGPRSWQCEGALYATLEEAKEALEELLKE